MPLRDVAAMWNQNNDIEEAISALGARACVELFSAYDLELEPGPLHRVRSDERLLSGCIGFVGQHIRGTCLLAATEKPLTASCPQRAPVLRDWVGELTNQLVGRLKSKLLARGVEVFVTTPIVLSGVRIEPLPRNRREPFIFSSSAGEVLVWLEVETEGNFVLGAERAGKTNEGDVVVF
jgi:hypothetical protein